MFGTRHRHDHHVSLLAVVTILVFALVPENAHGAASATECASSYEQAQILRREGRLCEARSAMVICSSSKCPGIVRKDCALWLSQIEGDIPTVVVVARGVEGTDLTDVRVSIDGRPVQTVARGQAFAVNPGEHVFRFERGESKPVQQTVVIHQGEKNRLIPVTMLEQSRTVLQEPEAKQAPSATPDDEARASAPSAPAPERKVSESSSKGAAFIVGAGSVLALGTSMYLGLTGRSDLEHLRTSCAPLCTDSDIASVKTKLIASDVTLGVGLVSLAIASYLFFIDSGDKPKGPGVSFDLKSNGVAHGAVLRGRFR